MTASRYLTFDCYGTLIDWRKGIEKSLTEEYGPLPASGEKLYEAYADAELAEERSYKKYREVLSRTSARLARRFRLRDDREADTRFADSVPSWPAFGDTAESLRELGKLGFERYILSNVDKDMIQETISRNGFEIDGVVAAEDVKSYKPSTAHWAEFFRMTGASKEEELHVAQSVFHDIVPAGEMGLSTAWVNRYSQRMTTAAQPTYVVGSLSDLVQVLSG